MVENRIYENAVVIGQLYRYCYHHPKAEVFERYRDMNIGRMRTDEDGAVLMHFGAQIEASAFRRQHARYWYGR